MDIAVLDELPPSSMIFKYAAIIIFIADTRHRSKGVTTLIPNYQAVIIDEAHKFLSAAREMYGNTISSNGIYKMTSYIRKIKFRNEQSAISINSYAAREERG